MDMWFPTPYWYALQSALEVLYEAHHLIVALGDPYSRGFLAFIWHKSDKLVKLHACGHVAKDTIGTILIVRVRIHGSNCGDGVEGRHPQKVLHVPYVRLGFHKHGEQVIHRPLHFEDSGKVGLPFVVGMGGEVMRELFVTIRTTFKFLSVLCIHGDIIDEEGEIYVLGVFSTILHIS